MMLENNIKTPVFIIIICIACALFAVIPGFPAAQEKEVKASPGGISIEYKAEGLRGPFYNAEDYIVEKEPQKPDLTGQETRPKRPLPDLSVQGIIWDTALPQAIINNKVVKIGDLLEEAQIIDISKSGITVLFDNQQYNLSVTKAGNKTQANQGGR